MTPKTWITPPEGGAGSVGPQSKGPHDLNEAERQLVDCYLTLTKVLSEQRDSLEPFEERNALKATAALWQVVNGLDLEPDQLYDIGA